MTRPPLITANITKNASNVPILLQFYKCFRYNKSFCSKTKKVQLRQLNLILYAAEAGDLRYEKGAVETTAPPW